MHQQRALRSPSTPPHSAPPRTPHWRSTSTRRHGQLPDLDTGKVSVQHEWEAGGRGFLRGLKAKGSALARVRLTICRIDAERSSMMISSFASCSRRHLAAAGDAWRFLFEQQDGDVMGGRRRAGRV